MASNGLRDQDLLEGASKYVIWKSRIEFLLDEHDLKALIDRAVAETSCCNTPEVVQEEYG